METEYEADSTKTLTVKDIELSKLDYVLYWFLSLTLVFNLKKLCKGIFSSTQVPVNLVEHYQKNIVLSFLFVLVFRLFGVVLFVVFSLVYIVFYLLIAAVTAVLSLVLVIVLSLFFGFFPFALRSHDQTEESRKDAPVLEGINKLLLPILWSINFFKDGPHNMFELAIRPIHDVIYLSHQKKSNFLLRASLVLGSLYSFVIYLGVFFLVIEIASSISIFVIGILIGFVWLVIKVFILFFKKTNEEEP